MNKWDTLKRNIELSIDIVSTAKDKMYKENIILNNILDTMNRLEKEQQKQFLFVFYNYPEQRMEAIGFSAKNAHVARHMLWNEKGRDNVAIQLFIDLGN